jgi:hypothetical protein
VSSIPSSKEPPPISTSDTNSFAAFTIRERLPELCDQVIEKNDLEGSTAAKLRELKQRLRTGTVRDSLAAYPYLRDRMEPEEHAAWRREIDRYIGAPWLGISWYFAESLFYLEILLAWGYYDHDGPQFRIDPFGSSKEEELQRSGGTLDARIDEETAGVSTLSKRVATLLLYSLWANRLDLSYSQLFDMYRDDPAPAVGRLLVDHRDTVTKNLLQAKRIDLILDNCGSELIADLHLIGALLQHLPERRIVLHCKRSPFYVSDALIRDVEQTITFLENNSGTGLGRFLSEQRKRGNLSLQDHHFWNGPLHFPELPPDLKQELTGSDLVILKGDLNYRRVLSDRRWSPTSDMQTIVGYFPAPLATLRTTKSELVVDLDAHTVQSLNRSDPPWRVEGRYGIIRYCDRLADPPTTDR